jgi:alcohol dehydrogenase (cytochrome c)
VVVNGVLYTIPGHVWAIDAPPGDLAFDVALRWMHIRWGVAVLGNTVYVKRRTAINTKRWRTGVCDLEQFYYGSTAPLIVKNHVIVGVSGDDLDIPGYLEARDPQTGDRQWRWYTYPEPGSPEAKTWPNEEAMTHGGGMTWGSSTYDPELNLLYFGTGNPQP